MNEYIIDYMFALPAYETTTITADSMEDADMQALQWLKETYPEATHVSVEAIQPVVK